MPAKPISPSQERYLSSEFDSLKEEINNLLEEIHKREKFSLTILGGVTAWILTEHFKSTDNHSLLLVFLSLIPVFSSLFYPISVKWLYRGIKLRGFYLKKIEEAILHQEGKDFNAEDFGWEKFFNGVIANTYEVPGKGRNYTSTDLTVAKVLWIIQISMGLILFLTMVYPYISKVLFS